MSADKDNSFITEHFALVHSIAGRFRNRGIEYDELFSAGCVGLVKAGNNFDESRGLKFSTYAVPVIMGEIKQLFRDGGTVKVSRSLKELSLKICRLRDELIKNGEEPHISVLAEKLGITPEEASLALGASLPPVLTMRKTTRAVSTCPLSLNSRKRLTEWHCDSLFPVLSR